ncbi:MAG TPA: MFS transporter [Candidatus Limnocylindrales bacterium]
MNAAPAIMSGSVPLHRNRDFLILWMSQAVSTVGTRVSGLAYPLLVLAITGSPAQAGVVAFAQTLPFLVFFLPAGALVDRWDRRRTMLLCEAGRFVALGSVAIAIAVDAVSIVQLVVVAFVEGSLFVFFDLAEGAALPRIVAASQVPSAVAQNQARVQGADVIGQPVGGALFSLGRAWPFVFDAISYLVSFVALLALRSPLGAPEAPAVRRTLRQEIAEGLRTVWSNAFLRAAVALAAGINFVFNGLTLVLIVRAQALGAGAGAIGLMFAAWGAGAIVGSVVAPSVQRRVGPRVALLGVVWIWVGEAALLALVSDVAALGVVAGLGAIAGPVFNVVLASLVYGWTPDRLLGRVRSVIKVAGWGAIPAGSLAGGLLAGGLGAQGAMVALAAVLLVVASLASVAPALRTTVAASPTA